MTTSPTVLYFGCLRDVGHFLWQTGGEKIAMVSVLPLLDGGYTPRKEKAQGKACLVEDNGWTILAWHDYTVDKRGNSNSAIIATGSFDFDRMLAFLQFEFPQVYARQTQPIVLA